MRVSLRERRFPKTFQQDQCVYLNLVSLHVLRLAGEWSGRWESNPRLKLGKLSPRVHIPSVPTWRPGGFPLFVDACTNCGDDSDPSTNPTDQATTEPAEFVLN